MFGMWNSACAWSVMLRLARILIPVRLIVEFVLLYQILRSVRDRNSVGVGNLNSGKSLLAIHSDDCLVPSSMVTVIDVPRALRQHPSAKLGARTIKLVGVKREMEYVHPNP